MKRDGKSGTRENRNWGQEEGNLQRKTLVGRYGPVRGEFIDI